MQCMKLHGIFLENYQKPTIEDTTSCVLKSEYMQYISIHALKEIIALFEL